MNFAESLKQRFSEANSGNPIKAVIYARVSTDNDAQKDSCKNQVYLAESFAKSHNCTIVDTFTDDGISAKNDYNRPEYVRMLGMIQKGGIDLIITKALARLNRDHNNSVELAYLLPECNTTIYTLEDGQLHDFEDPNSDLFRCFTFAIDAQYVQRQSIYGRKTQEIRCQRKLLSSKDISFGYVWIKDTKTISINESKAEIVKYIFEEYVFRGTTPAQIMQNLASEDGPYKLKLNKRTILNILADERYIGNFYINKKTTVLGRGHRASRRINRPREEWVLVERPDLRIIDDDVFAMAQRIHKNRITICAKPDQHPNQAYFQGHHLFAGKIFCATCGRPLQWGNEGRHVDNKVALYRVRRHSGCTDPAGRVVESDLEAITQTALRTILRQQEAVVTSLEQILTECVKANNSNGEQIASIKKQIATKESQIDQAINNLIDDLSLSEETRKRAKEKIAAKERDVADLRVKLQELEAQQFDPQFVAKKVSEIRNGLNELRSFKTVDRDRIINFIERYVVHPGGDIDVILRTGQSVPVPATRRGVGITAVKTDIDPETAIRPDYIGKALYLLGFPYVTMLYEHGVKCEISATVRCYLRTDKG